MGHGRYERVVSEIRRTLHRKKGEVGDLKTDACTPPTEKRGKEERRKRKLRLKK